MKCDICDKEVLIFGQYWKADATKEDIDNQNPNKLLLTVCVEHDKLEYLLDSKNSKTKVLREWVKIQPKPVL